MLDLKPAIVDVDGSYMYRKQQKLAPEEVNTQPLSLPDVLLTAWEVVDASNFKDKHVPQLTHG